MAVFVFMKVGQTTGDKQEGRVFMCVCVEGVGGGVCVVGQGATSRV